MEIILKRQLKCLSNLENRTNLIADSVWNANTERKVTKNVGKNALWIFSGRIVFLYLGFTETCER